MCVCGGVGGGVLAIKGLSAWGPGPCQSSSSVKESERRETGEESSSPITLKLTKRLARVKVSAREGVPAMKTEGDGDCSRMPSSLDYRVFKKKKKYSPIVYLCTTMHYKTHILTEIGYFVSAGPRTPPSVGLAAHFSSPGTVLVSSNVSETHRYGR